MRKSKILPNMCTSPVLQSRLGSEYRTYSPTALLNAYFKVLEEDMSIRGAARKYGVPEATLRDRVSGRISAEVLKSGTEPIFSLEEEARLAEHLKTMESFGYGYSRSEVVDMASLYAVSLQKRDADHPLSLMWFRNFIKRWPDIKVKKPRSLELQRAKATSEENVNNYFCELDKILTKYDLRDSPERIYNVDEKGVKPDHTPPFVVASADSTVPSSAVVSGKGATATIIGCGNALGQHIPPYFIFPGQRMRQELLNGCTPGADGTVSETGWSNSQIFQHYLSTHFSKYVQCSQAEKPILILYDGHKSHVTIPLIDWAKERNIVLFVLPAHTSHVLQPLDVGCFGPFQTLYNHACHRYMRDNSVRGVDRYAICGLACKCYIRALKPENLQSSFRRSGIYPFNANAVDRANFIPATVFKKSESHQTRELVDNEAQDLVQEVVNGDQAQEADGDQAQEVNVTQAQEEVDTQAQAVDVTQAQQIDVTQAQQVDVTQAQQVDVTQAQQVDVTQAQQVFDDQAQQEVCDQDQEISVQFFKDREERVGLPKKATKKRKCLSYVVSGKPITEDDIRDKIEDHQNNVSGKKNKTSKGKKPKPKKCVKKSKSGDIRNTFSPQPGPSGILRTHLSSPELSSDEEIDESEKCCRCKRFQPVELSRSDSVYFTSWGQCMYEMCRHWTHLKYCCSVKRLRSKDSFIVHAMESHACLLKNNPDFMMNKLVYTF